MISLTGRFLHYGKMVILTGWYHNFWTSFNTKDLYDVHHVHLTRSHRWYHRFSGGWKTEVCMEYQQIGGVFDSCHFCGQLCTCLPCLFTVSVLFNGKFFYRYHHRISAFSDHLRLVGDVTTFQGQDLCQ
jgi:hypothetical protein